MKNFQLVKDFPGYISKVEVSNVDAPYLTPGSYNVLIDEAKRVSSRKGYKLFGAAKTTTDGIKSSYEWLTSSDTEIPLRSYKNHLQAYFYDQWRTIKSGWADNVNFEFAPWWYFEEIIDILLFVNGNDKIYSWSGAHTKVRSITATTITKMFSLTDTSIYFVPATGSDRPKIIDNNSNFLDAGFAVGDNIVVSGSSDNDGTYLIYSVSAGEIQLSPLNTLITEVAGASITISVENKDTWAVQRFLTQGSVIGDSTTQFDITNPSGTTFRYTFDGTGTDPEINSDNLIIGNAIVLNAQNFNAGNNGTFTITGVGSNYFEVTNASGVVESNKTIGTGSIVLMRKKVVINDVEYYYGGGEETATLTHVYPSPVGSVSNGDIVFQGVEEDEAQPIQGAKNDIIGVFQNQIYLGSKTNRDVFISKNDNYKSFAFTTPLRLPGEGALLTLDNPPKAFIPQESQMNIGAGRNDIYQVVFTISSDNQYEACTVDKYKTSNGQAPISQSAVTNIKNSVAFITHEPSLDTLGRLEQINTPQSKPISDIIKNDFEKYNLNKAHTRYWRNNIFIAIPEETIVIIYDLENGFWQPPQKLAISRIAVINNKLYGHSSGGNETYELFTGYNDNGVTIPFMALFAYQNYGDRASLKSYDNIYVETYMTQTKNGLKVTVDEDFEGSSGSSDYFVDGSDRDLLFGGANEDASLGGSSIGTVPLGGQYEDQDEFMDGTKKFRVFFERPIKDFFELRYGFSSSIKDFRFKLLAFGVNASISTNKPTWLTR